MVIEKLAVAGERVDEVEAYHEVQRLRSEALFAKNEECIKANLEIKEIFKKESDAFFSERLKWKSDVKMQVDE